LTEIVAAGVEQGVFRDVDPELTATLVLAALDSARGGKLVLGDDEAPDEMYLALGELVYPTLGIDRPD
jgi:hypothetical protein